MHLYFLHIPKTGGTSLDVLLKLQYSKKDIHPWDNIKFPKLQRMYRQNILKPQNFKILKGHFYYGIHNYLSDSENYSYITLLRNPVDRVKSHLRQFLRMPNSFIFREYKKEKNLYKLIKNNKYSFSNLQTAWIAGVHTTKGLNEKDLFDRAISNIEKDFLYVGIVELFNESLFQIYKRANWKYKPYYNSLNKSSEKELNIIKFDNDTISLIKDLNLYDIQLYNKYKPVVEKDHQTLNKREYNDYLTKLKYFQYLHNIYIKIKNLY